MECFGFVRYSIKLIFQSFFYELGSTAVTSTCHDLWISVFQFLSMLLQTQGASALEAIAQAVPNVWCPLSGNFRYRELQF